MKTKDNEGNYSVMNVGELKEMIKDKPDDLEIFIRVCHNPTGNIVEAGNVEKSTYVFFGNPIDCLIIEPSYTGYAKK